MKRVTLVLTIIAIPFLSATGCRPPQDDTQERAFESLISAERAFAATSVATDTRTAFLEFFADDGVIFDAGPVNARSFWEQRPAGGPHLSWGPEIADVSAAGDMGYTSGPYEVRMAPDSDAVAWGHFVSVWRRNVEGAWRVVADGGSAHGPASLGTDSIVTRLGMGETQPIPLTGADLGPMSAALSETDESYSRSMVDRGIQGSLDEYVSRSVRFYRNGKFPLVGRGAITDSALGHAEVWKSWENRGIILATSGDLGCTYGILNLDAEVGQPAQVGSASYYRIWKRQANADWRVVVDVLIPIPPANE